MNTGNPKVDWLRIALGVDAATLLRDPLVRRGSAEQQRDPVSSRPMPTPTLRLWRDDDGGVGDGPAVDAPPAKPAPPPPDPKAKEKWLNEWNPLVRRYNATDFEPSATPRLKELFDKWDSLSDDAKKKAKAGDYAGALAALPAAKDALKAYLDEAEAVDKATKPQAVAAANKVSTLVKKKELAGKTNAEKLELLNALRAPATKMTDDFKKAQFEIYKDLELDPKFVAEDKKKREQTVKTLVGTAKDKEEMKKMRDGWGDLKPDEKHAFIKKTVAAHCKALGIPAPKNVEFRDLGATRVNPTTIRAEGGNYDHKTGTLLINDYPDGPIGDFAETLKTIFHENSHHYQHELVDKLEKQQLSKEDPEYEEALLFQANFEPQGYVDPNAYNKDANEAYHNQPSERHSFSNGPDTAKDLLDALQ